MKAERLGDLLQELNATFVGLLRRLTESTGFTGRRSTRDVETAALFLQALVIDLGRVEEMQTVQRHGLTARIASLGVDMVLRQA